MNPIRRGGRPAKTTLSQRHAEGAARIRREFLEITADYTGARAVVGSEAMEAGIDRIFEENELVLPARLPDVERQARRQVPARRSSR